MREVKAPLYLGFQTGNRLRCTLLCLLLAFGPAPAAFAQAAEQAARMRKVEAEYPRRTLAEAVSLAPSGPVTGAEAFAAQGRPLRTSPTDLEYRGTRIRRVPLQFRAVARFTGRERATEPLLLDAIDLIEQVNGREGSRRLFPREYAFDEGGRTYWLAVSALNFWDKGKDAFKPGEPYLLFVQAAGWLPDGRAVMTVALAAPDATFPRSP